MKNENKNFKNTIINKLLIYLQPQFTRKRFISMIFQSVLVKCTFGVDSWKKKKPPHITLVRTAREKTRDMHHPNGAWLTLPWGLPFQKLVAVPFPVQHPYHALQTSPATGPPLIALHPNPGATAAAALPATLQTFVPAAFSLQPQPLTIRQVRVNLVWRKFYSFTFFVSATRRRTAVLLGSRAKLHCIFLYCSRLKFMTCEKDEVKM